MKKQINRHKLMLIIILLLSLTINGCGKVTYRKLSANKIETSYHEWAKEVLFSNESPQVTSYKEYSEINLINVVFSKICDDRVNGYSAMEALISRHNQFIIENPDYFPLGTNIKFIVPDTSQYTELVFSSHYGQAGDEAVLQNNYDASVNYAIAFMSPLHANPLDKSINITIDNLVLNFDAPPDVTAAKDYYEIISSFQGFKNIIVNDGLSGTNYLDEKTYLEDISGLYPNAKVFFSRSESIRN